MSNHNIGSYILGYTLENKKLRPSDWVDRIASVYATFERQRLCYHPMIKPVYYENERCLFFDAALSDAHPEVYNFVMDFARSNSLQIKVEGDSAIKFLDVA